MSQRAIELVVGRLITDEAFRERFLAAPDYTVLALTERGLELSRREVAALLSTDPALWAKAAETLDPRLQKVSVTVSTGQ